jgi:hypothetical protein
MSEGKIAVPRENAYVLKLEGEPGWAALVAQKHADGKLVQMDGGKVAVALVPILWWAMPPPEPISIASVFGLGQPVGATTWVAIDGDGEHIECPLGYYGPGVTIEQAVEEFERGSGGRKPSPDEVRRGGYVGASNDGKVVVPK